MGEVDQSFKRLFLLQVGALLKWLLGEIRDITPLSTDLATERQLLPDTLYRAAYQGFPCIANVEVQSEPDEEIRTACISTQRGPCTNTGCRSSPSSSGCLIAGRCPHRHIGCGLGAGFYDQRRYVYRDQPTAA